MKISSIILLSVLVSAPIFGDPIFRIEVGKDYQSYSHGDLQRRVWELERAVFQLQQRVFQLESTGNLKTPDTWVCTVEAMSDSYSGTGPSKAMASHTALENCKAGRGGDGFFCKNPKCSQ